MVRGILVFAACAMLLASAGCCTVKRGSKCAAQGAAEDICTACGALFKADSWMRKNLW